MATTKPPGPKGYSQRNSLGTTVPMEVDSDSDFNPKPYVYEKPKKMTKRGSSKGRKRKREDVDEADEEKYDLPKAKTKYRPPPQAVNPLLQYFEQEDVIDLCSASEEEEEDDDDDEGAEADEKPRADASDPINQRDLDIYNRTWGITKKPPPPPPPVVDDSATELESDWDAKSPVPKVAPEVDDSATELESDWDARPTRPAAMSGSETESEEDEDEPIRVDASMKPRPGFTLTGDQKELGPLVLDAAKKIKVPGPINTYLREYQRDGVRFFYRQFSQGMGGLLGDDMGLGKTIQVISFLSAIMQKNGVKTDGFRRRNHVSKLQDGEGWKKRKELPPANATWPTCLIIAPSTVAQNWEREFSLWGYFEVGMFTGAIPDRKRVLQDFKMGRLDVMITSFDLARREINSLDDLPFSCVFVDEAHKLKNLSSGTTQAYHQFLCKHRFALTGTAIQNSYNEMYTVLDWTNPGKLGTVNQWKGFVQKPLTQGQSSRAAQKEKSKSERVAKILHDKILPPFFLRRTKDIIKDQLPQKYDNVVFCPLSPFQLETYRRIVDSPIIQNLIHKDDPCPCGSGNLRKKCCHSYDSKEMLRHISILIKLSNHLALILPSPKDTQEQLERNRELAAIVWPRGNAPMWAEATIQPDCCGKWKTLDSLLSKWRKDTTNKVLIFTKSVKLIKMLEFFLETRNYKSLTLEGETKPRDRMGLIDQFQNDPEVFIFLISTLAGGTGLNLTSANRVVIFDPNWNPAHDLQAMDRAFRFGQTRDVYVYRLLGAGSLEELIYARQIYKQQQMHIGYDASIQTRYFEGVQGDPTKQGELFGLKNLFKLQTEDEGLATKMTIEKADVAALVADLSKEAKSATLPGGKKKKNLEHIKLDSDKTARDDSLDDLKGLDSLLDGELFDADDELHTTLAATGVKYTHRNDEILVPSKGRDPAPKRRKTNTGTAHGRGKKEGFQWPKPRAHHLRKQQQQQPSKRSPEALLSARMRALIDLEFIQTPADLPAFARIFAKETPEAQTLILHDLDHCPLRDFSDSE